MIVEATISIRASQAAVWAAITDIEGLQKIISGIERIEIVERPTSEATGLKGLRWRETRLLFGKPATAEKWITEVSDHAFYESQAQSDGFIFVTTLRLSARDGAVLLTSSHDSRPQTLRARLMAMTMLLLFRGTIRNAVLQDLNDIKAALEGPAKQAA